MSQNVYRDRKKEKEDAEGARRVLIMSGGGVSPGILITIPPSVKFRSPALQSHLGCNSSEEGTKGTHTPVYINIYTHTEEREPTKRRKKKEKREAKGKGI